MRHNIEKPLQNMQKAGTIFMFIVWLQGQMCDLIILKNNPHLIDDFVANPLQVPEAFHRLRVKYWEKQFGDIKNEFIQVFCNSLSELEKSELEEIFCYRNMIAHAHVSIGRDYMLYRPSGDRKELEVISALKPKPSADISNPVMFVLEFWREEVFIRLSDQIGRIDQKCFSRIANMLNIPHGRIR